MVMLVRLLCAILLWAGAAPVYAQTYPAKTIRIVVPFPPAGSADLLSRTIGQKLTAIWGQPIVVDNRPGAGGNLGLELVAKAPPDGYTAVMAAITTNAIGMSTYTKLGYNLEKDLAPVTLVANIPHILVAHPSLPVKNVKDLVALGKARPGEIIFASQGAGTLSHLEQELLKTMGGFKALHVPYKGSAPGIADLMAGNVQLFFDSIPSALPHIKSGRVRAIGVASSTRSPALPDVPAIGELLKGFAADSWFGLMMPAGTPRDIINRFDAEVRKALASQEVKERLLAVGGFVQAGGPDQLAARIKEDLGKWGKVARATGVKIE
ncbi:MAG: tripartite tricarboxylate transporter substrate binding protein [Betaproteobacteria bacterium]|nr:tripartite tricarboxylate transporter substrate binding protein [Betaproteobacteria bacterium]